MYVSNRRSILPVVLPTVVALCLVLVQMPLASGQDARFSATAQLWDYETLCKFPDSGNYPSAMTYHAGFPMTVTGCSDLEEKLGHPQAVRITLVNSGDSVLEVPVEGLSSIVLKTRDGKTIPALAWRVRDRNPLGSGYYDAFANKMNGKVTVKLKPMKSCDLIFLFASGSAGDSIKIGQLASVRITV